MKQCLIVIDMQNGVFTLQKPVFQKDRLIENILKAVRFAGECEIPVIFSLHENNTFLKRGTAGYQLVEPLAIREGDQIIRKSKPDVFLNTELDAILRNKGISSLIITGVISNGCVKRACQSALEKSYHVTLVKDAHSTFYGNAAKVIERINGEMESAGARIVSVDEL